MDDSDIEASESENIDWKDILICVYLFVCRRWATRLHTPKGDRTTTPIRNLPTRKSSQLICSVSSASNWRPKDIHEYDEDRLPEWFSDLPSYAGYVRLPGNLSAVFALLIQATVAEIGSEEVVETLRIADSFPVMVAKDLRRRRLLRRLPIKATALQKKLSSIV